MSEDIRELLDNEITDEIKQLSTLTLGSKEHSEAIDGLAKLYRLVIDESKTRLEYQEKVDQATYDDQFKWKQLRSEELGRYIRYGIDAAGIILPLIFYAAWMRQGFRFEETGTFTSKTFQGLFSKFRPTGK